MAFNPIISKRQITLDAEDSAGHSETATDSKRVRQLEWTDEGTGESGLNASFAISDADAPSAPLKMAFLLMEGMICGIMGMGQSFFDHGSQKNQNKNTTSYLWYLPYMVRFILRPFASDRAISRAKRKLFYI